MAGPRVFARRIIGSVGGAVTNWLAHVKPTLKITTVLTAIIGTVKAGIAVSQSAFTLLMDQKPAANIVQIQIDLTHASHVVTAAQDAGATANWTNPTNMQGAPDGSDATIGGSALLLVASLLRGTMVAQVSRPSTLIIDRVDLDWYGQTSGLPVVDDLVSRLILGWRINLSPVPAADKSEITLATSNINFHSTPQTARIDNGAGAFTDLLGTAVTWANIALIQPYFNAQIVLGLTGVTYRADAIRLRVTAHETWVP